jgi:hypothetical protein
MCSSISEGTVRQLEAVNKKMADRIRRDSFPSPYMKKHLHTDTYLVRQAERILREAVLVPA